MQYLLSEDEMAEFRELRERMAKMPELGTIQAVATHMACHMLDLRPPNCGKVRDRPHGCIHDERTRTGDLSFVPEYCDRCPASAICRLPKEWSK